MTSNRRRITRRAEIDNLELERARVHDRQLGWHRPQSDGQQVLVRRQPQRIGKSQREHVLEAGRPFRRVVVELDHGQQFAVRRVT